MPNLGQTLVISTGAEVLGEGVVIVEGTNLTPTCVAGVLVTTVNAGVTA